jgi:hypothetical protein
MESGRKHLRYSSMAALAALWALMTPFAISAARDSSIEQLKERVGTAAIGERPSLCIQICERELDAADHLYQTGDTAQAQTLLGDLTVFAERARDYAIQSRKHEKQSEIAIRKMTRKLMNLKHSVSHEDQQQIQDTIDKLQKIRDDLLAAMFPNGVKR